MRTVEEFIKGLVKVEFIDNEQVWGHHPYSMYYEVDGKSTIMALASMRIHQLFYKAKEAVLAGADKLFLSADFPKLGMDNDFVAVFSWGKGKEASILAIPYNIETGEVFPTIAEHSTLVGILGEFNKSVFNKES